MRGGVLARCARSQTGTSKANAIFRPRAERAVLPALRITRYAPSRSRRPPPSAVPRRASAVVVSRPRQLLRLLVRLRRHEPEVVAVVPEEGELVELAGEGDGGGAGERDGDAVL